MLAANSINLKDYRLWLLGLATCLTTIYFTLVWRLDNADLLGNSVLFVGAVAMILRDRWQTLSLNSSAISTGLGSAIIGVVLVRSQGYLSEPFLLLFPLLAALGLALLASGISGLKQYRKEILILMFLGLPKLILPILFDPTVLTAKFSALVLWYSGFEVERYGYYIQLGDRAVEVFQGCSGIEGISYLTALAGLFIMMFPLGIFARWAALILAGMIAFLVNGFRVALLAHFVYSAQPNAFDYWHHGTGSFIFSMISVAIFGGICWVFLQRQTHHESEVSP